MLGHDVNLTVELQVWVRKRGEDCLHEQYHQVDLQADPDGSLEPAGRGSDHAHLRSGLVARS